MGGNSFFVIKITTLFGNKIYYLIFTVRYAVNTL